MLPDLKNNFYIIKKFRRSLFFRLSILIIVFTLALVFALVWGFWFSFERQDSILDAHEAYFYSNMVENWGIPPDTVHVKKDIENLHLSCAIYLIDNDYSIDMDNIEDIINSLTIDISDSTDKKFVLVNGENVIDRLRDNQISSMVSTISSNETIRKKMVMIQRNISRNKSIVVDGRDIGTVVFPDADYKFYLTASIKERALRRYQELKKDKSNISLNLIEEEIKKRDRLDKSRKNSPLKKATDSIIIDTTSLNINEQVNIILETIKNNS